MTGPILANQPVLIVEIPREYVYPTTTLKYAGAPNDELDLTNYLAPSRWKFIGKFLIVYTKMQQVR
jgi:hypothetical protein